MCEPTSTTAEGPAASFPRTAGAFAVPTGPETAPHGTNRNGTKHRGADGRGEAGARGRGAKLPQG
ncbi:hypothetical protein [Streptomyces sp. TLI_105]|uniref:hypothetical protein n=1 Tax=Streptomyces sp. TLI_105 TaxID=1881019 RepID=UPI000B85E1BF|nr:hypothetical protein [Streptomyces sp. TLI_105]